MIKPIVRDVFFLGQQSEPATDIVKKTPKTPPGEIRLAKDRRKDWIDRHQQENDIAAKKNRR